jgi:hypothetical protein
MAVPSLGNADTNDVSAPACVYHIKNPQTLNGTKSALPRFSEKDLAALQTLLAAKMVSVWQK